MLWRSPQQGVCACAATSRRTRGALSQPPSHRMRLGHRRQAACAGAGQRVLLLDEVDAALDEPNQARVAALLKQLAGGSGAAARQVLAVTHNAAFQAAGRLIQVQASRGRVPSAHVWCFFMPHVLVAEHHMLVDAHVAHASAVESRWTQQT